jgi:hypothetical protein
VLLQVQLLVLLVMGLRFVLLLLLLLAEERLCSKLMLLVVRVVRGLHAVFKQVSSGGASSVFVVRSGRGTTERGSTL